MARDGVIGTSTGRLLGCLLLSGWLSGGLCAEELTLGTGLWRVFGPEHGLPAAPAAVLSVSPRGGLWILHANSGGVSTYDGYSVRRLGMAPPGSVRVAENRTGQIWSLNRDAILEWRRDGWRYHRVEELRRAVDAASGSLGDSTTLLPAERNNVLILLPEIILKHDVFQGTSAVLGTAQASGLGLFLDFWEARDGGAWIVGERGVAHVAGPVRRLSASTPWKVSLLPSAPPMRVEGRAFETADGGVVVMAVRQGVEGRVALTYDGSDWTDPVALPEGVHRAWQGPGDHLWAMGSDRLLCKEAGVWNRVIPPGWEAVRYWEVAVHADGSFWVGSTAGVARYAEAQWQHPRGLPADGGAVHSLVDLADGSLWFAGPDRICRLSEDRWETTPLRAVGAEGISGRLFPLQGDVVFLEVAGRLVVAEAAGRIRFEGPPAGWRAVQILGMTQEGRLLVQLQQVAGEGSWRLDVFDGARWEVFFEPGTGWTLGDRLTFAYASRSGTLWLGSDMGLAFWNEREQEFRVMESYSYGGAVSLIDAGGGRLWCSSGREVVEGDGRSWSVLRSSPGGVERLVLLKDGSVWALGGDKVQRYWEGSWVEQQGYAGLGAVGVHDVGLDSRGRLWAATEEGVQVHHPEADLDPPRSQIESTAGRWIFPTGEPVELRLQGADRWEYAPAELLVYSTRLNEGAWSPYSVETRLVLTNLTAGAQRLEVRSMDPAFNEQPEPAVLEFTAFVPWYREPRIVAVAVAGVLVALVLAALAANRHLRLVRSYSEVERMVAQRTRELERANEELVHSQKMRALGTLAAGIAHDFNSILSIIKGSAQIIEGATGDPEKIRTRVDRIKKMVEQGAGIVRAMLGLSRTSRQEWRVVQMEAFLQETIRLVADQLPSGVRLHLDPTPDLPPVRIASDLFRQLLLNLILNAGESMAGEGQILLRAWLGDEVGNVVLPPAARGEHLVVEVLDTGRGIEPEVLPRIFEPFFTTKAFSTRKGTGLGLTMVHEIAREMGVGLGVESTPGQGSIFRVYVPLKDRGQEEKGGGVDGVGGWGRPG